PPTTPSTYPSNHEVDAPALNNLDTVFGTPGQTTDRTPQPSPTPDQHAATQPSNPSNQVPSDAANSGRTDNYANTPSHDAARTPTTQTTPAPAPEPEPEPEPEPAPKPEQTDQAPDQNDGVDLNDITIPDFGDGYGDQNSGGG